MRLAMAGAAALISRTLTMPEPVDLSERRAKSVFRSPFALRFLGRERPFQLVVDQGFELCALLYALAVNGALTGGG